MNFLLNYLGKLTLGFIEFLNQESDSSQEPDHSDEWNDSFQNFNTAYILDVLHTVYECEQKYRFPRRRKAWLGVGQPWQSKPTVYALHKCPACGSNKIVLMIYGEETIWKCATEGCVVPARQFVTITADQMGESS